MPRQSLEITPCQGEGSGDQLPETPRAYQKDALSGPDMDLHLYLEGRGNGLGKHSGVI
ncbi:hypothetical protein ES703_101626 [subsurface metagenome]